MRRLQRERGRIRMTFGAFALWALLAPGRALAAPAFAAPSAGQPGLAVGSDPQGTLRAKLCSAASCDLSDGVELGVPRALAPNVPRARLELVGIGNGRRAIVVTVPGGADGRPFQAIVVAPLVGGTPSILFAEQTGLIEGPDGVRLGKSVAISEPDEGGARRIVVGLQREDLELCGRPAVLSPQMLSPQDLTLHAAKVQRLLPAEREQAAELGAVRTPDDAQAASVGVLSALGASSALGAVSGVTDGRLDTAWVENRGGSGRGEFVIMRAPPELPLKAFDLVVRSAAPSVPKSAVPRELWLVTKSQIFHVTLPDEAATAPGQRFRVILPKPVQTDCVGLVLEAAFEERPNAEVGVVELAAVSDLGAVDPAGLVAALAGGGERARAAGALLRALGVPGFAAIIAGFDTLDEGGRRVALDAVDAAACEQSIPVYVAAIGSGIEAERVHAKDRLLRCGRASADLLVERFLKAKPGPALSLVDELALVAPDRAVEALAVRIAKAPTRERRGLRVVLARAAALAEARASVVRLLGDAGLPNVVTLDLLRALGPRVPSFQPFATAALGRLEADASFRTRYLMLEPAAKLAPGDARARAAVERSLVDRSDARLRVRALEVIPRDAQASAAFLAGLSDESPRVREASAHGLLDVRASGAAPKLSTLLADDAWPLVRRAAAEALAALPPEPKGDAALLAALADEAWGVRAAAAAALGARHVARAVDGLRRHFVDAEEHFEVRRSAAAALAALCDQASLDALTKSANKLTDPLATVEERAVAESALRALSALAPPDLPARLKALLASSSAPAAQRAIADSAKVKACR